MDTPDLVVFLAVARAGSLGAAADELRLATPSVSARMAELEHKLTAELFIRTTRGSQLTTAGQRFLPYARRCLEVLEEAHQAVRVDSVRRLVVSAPASLGDVVFPSVLRVLAESSLHGHCRVAHSNEVVNYLLDGTADLGVVLSKALPPSICTRSVHRSPILAVCSPNHPLANCPTLAVDDLLTSPVAVYRWDSESEELAEIFEHPRRPSEHPVQLLGLPAAILELLADGYVGVVPKFAAAAALRAGRIAELALMLPGWSIDVQLAHRRDATETGKATSLLDSVAEAVRSGFA